MQQPLDVGEEWDVSAGIPPAMRRSTLPPQVWLARGDQHPPAERHFEPVEQGNLPVKPSGGMWTSSFNQRDDTFVSDWHRWCVQNEYFASGEYAYVLTVADDITVIEVTGLDDLKRLVKTYYDASFYDGLPTRAIRDYPIDFESMAADGVDAVHLTESGLRETHLPGCNEPNLYGWDSESTLWLSWGFDDVVAFLGSVPTSPK